ncbi:hypothetical protein ScPMuIL_012061 [Solemya velum]
MQVKKLLDIVWYAASVGAKHFHTSAKLSKGIEEMFLDLSRNMIEKAGENNHKTTKTANNRQNVLVVNDDAPVQKSGGGCC